MINTLDELRTLLADVQYEDWLFNTGEMGNGFFVQVYFWAPDNDGHSAALTEQHGRKWYISKHATRDETVQTCLKAVFTAVEHEVRERFRYKGVAVFNTHIQLDKLVEASQHQSVREPMLRQ